MRTILSLFILTSLMACTGEISVSSSSKPIINGTVDNVALHDAVPFVYNTAGFACGGTLISPNVLMTAAHCVTYENSTTPYAPGYFQVYFCRDLNNCNPDVRERGVIEVYRHPSYSPSNTSYDFALLRLDAPAPGDVQVIPPLPSSMGLDSSDAGMAITFVGFGLTDGYDDTSTSEVRMQFTGSIAGVCHTSGGCSLGSGYYAQNLTIYTSQSAGGTCQGDSGGPGLVSLSGTTYVAGITSYGYSNCTGPGVYTEVSSYANEIQSFINNPPVENCTDGQDNNGNGMVDCADPGCSSASQCPVSPCLDAGYVSCNTTKEGNTADGVAAFSSYSCLSSGEESGTELAWMISMPEGAVATFTLHSLDQDLDLFIVEGDNDDCSAQSCLDASIEGGLTDEVLTYTVTSQTAYLIAESYQFPGRFTLTVDCDLPPENCDNGVDDDMNGLTDCNDPACAQEHHCLVPDHETVCDNGLDDDEDGLTDCADPDCLTDTVCGVHTELA
ncbi:trypsin-like serine protease, partial [Myxococcota bacterium]|nr:trypsin-like serine protease [Myxococcota bacterium]MBU1536624.1 trypsin-like serine protease [Myxococcota bacterium]